MPEEDRLLGPLAPGLQPRGNLADLGVEALAADLAGIDVRPERAEGPGVELAEIVHDEGVEPVDEIERQRAHRAIGDDQRAGPHPTALEQRLRLGQARRLDLDVGAFQAALPVGRRLDLLAEIGGKPGGEGLAALRPARMHADLGEVEQVVEQPHVPIGRAARADMAEHARPLGREIPGAERRHGARPHIGQPGGVDDRAGRAGLGIEERQKPHFGRQAMAIVAVEVTHDLDAGEAERRHITAQHVEVAVGRPGPQMHARLDHRLAAPGRDEARFDGLEDLGIGEAQRLDRRAAQIVNLDRHPSHPRWLRPSPLVRARRPKSKQRQSRLHLRDLYGELSICRRHSSTS